MCACRFWKRDVALPVVRQFMQRVKDKAIGQSVALRAKAQVPTDGKPGEKALKQMEVSPEYHFIRICQEELTALMGNPEGGPTEINWAKKGPTVFMMVGLQGSGKNHDHREAGALAAEDPQA